MNDLRIASWSLAALKVTSNADNGVGVSYAIFFKCELTCAHKL